MTEENKPEITEETMETPTQTTPETETDETTKQKLKEYEDAMAIQKEYIEAAEKILGIEEITITYNGVKSPKNGHQVSVEIMALRNLIKNIESRISSLENQWAVILERQRIMEILIKEDAVKQQSGAAVGAQKPQAVANEQKPACTQIPTCCESSASEDLPTCCPPEDAGKMD